MWSVLYLLFRRRRLSLLVVFLSMIAHRLPSVLLKKFLLLAMFEELSVVCICTFVHRFSVGIYCTAIKGLFFF